MWADTPPSSPSPCPQTLPPPLLKRARPPRASASISSAQVRPAPSPSVFLELFFEIMNHQAFIGTRRCRGVRCRPINTALWVPRASRKHRLEIREGSVPPKLKLAEISHVGAMPLDARHAVHFNPDRASSSQTASSRAARSRRRVTQFLRSTRVPALLPSPPGSGARVGVASS